MEPALIFFDVDGTILDGAYRVPASAVRAIRAARSRGHLCVVNTGRPLSHVEPAVRDIGFDGYICSCGQHVILAGQTVFRRQLPGEVCRRVLELVRAGNLDVVFEVEEGIWFDRTRPLRREVRETFDHFAARGFDVSRPVDREDLQFDKFCVWTGPGGDPEALLRYIGDYCTVIHREGDLLEFVAKGCSKETGIRLVMDRTGIPLARCYAIGDSANDLGMLRMVPHSVAMGHAPREVRAAVEYVTDTLPRDGLQKALRRYGLI